LTPIKFKNFSPQNVNFLKLFDFMILAKKEEVSEFEDMKIFQKSSKYCTLKLLICKCIILRMNLISKIKSIREKRPMIN